MLLRNTKHGEIPLKSITVSGNTVYLDKSTDFAHYYKSGKLIMKSARIAELKNDNTVIFDDGSVEQHDVIILCTGYQMSYPFLKEEGLVKLTHKNKYWPLYKRIFCIDDPRLMFIGQHDTGFLEHFIRERQSITIREVIAGKVKLPSWTERWRDLVSSWEKYGFDDSNLQNFYRLSTHDYELQIINEFHSVVPHLTLNKKFLAEIGPVIGKCFEHVLKGDWITFYEGSQYIALVKEGYVSDTEEYDF